MSDSDAEDVEYSTGIASRAWWLSGSCPFDITTETLRFQPRSDLSAAPHLSPPTPDKMFFPPEHRVPVEIWEKILLEFISAQSMLVFATSCSAVDYLIFKRTCGDGAKSFHRYEYAKFQQSRRSIRGVCRSWKTFFDQWDQHDKWAYRASIRENHQPYHAAYAWRLDLRGCHAQPLLSEWKQMREDGRYNSQLLRMEILDIQPEFFASLLRDLCNVAPVLKNLRSLGLTIMDKNYTIMEKLSLNFLQLTHLTLCLHHLEHRSSSNDPPLEERGSSMLKKLEVLFLFPGRRTFDIGQWNLPSLRHFHMRPGDPLDFHVYGFLKRHAQIIETIDVDNDEQYGIRKSQMNQGDIAFPLDFWETFINLKLLRCNWGKMQLETLPDQDHPIESDSVEQALQLCDVLRPWAEPQNVKTLKRVVLYGYFLTKGYHLCEKGELPRLIGQLAKNGTRLMNPAGKSWI